MTLMNSNSYILKYWEEIKHGRILVGHELVLEMKRLVSYISDPIVQERMQLKIDFEESNKRIRFIETKCKHYEAPFAGRPFLLELFQKAFIEAIFAIKIYDDELGKYIRLHQEILFLVARKNGKTPLIGAICLAEWFCGYMGLKIMCASNDDQQAGLMFDAINAMREESPSLAKVTRKNLKGIYFGNPRKKSSKGKFSYQNKGNIKKLSAKASAKEGRNLGVGAVDEVFEMKDDSTVMPIKQALSTQDEPLYFELTTEGFTNDGYLDVRLIEARQVLAGEVDKPNWLIWMYTQDSEQEVWQDEKSWVKSNPGLGVIKKWKYLRGKVEDAKRSKSERAFVLAKDFNIKQNNAEAWLQSEDINNDLTYHIDELAGAIGIGATDLSETTDLTSARVLVMRPGSNIKYMLSMYFIPETKVVEGSKQDDRDYLQWAKEGWLTICPGNEVDYSDIVTWYVSLYKKYGIWVFKEGHDRWNAKSFVSELDDYNIENEKVSQDFNNMSPGMKSLEADLKANLVNYNQNPIDKWCLENTSCRVDNIGRIMPVKVQDMRNRRIDGAVTMIIAYAMLDRYKKEYSMMIR